MNSGLRSGCALAQLKLARGYEGRDLRACQMVKGQDIDRSLTLYEAAAKTSAEAQLVLAVHFEGLRSARFCIPDTYEMPAATLDGGLDQSTHVYFEGFEWDKALHYYKLAADAFAEPNWPVGKIRREWSRVSDAFRYSWQASIQAKLRLGEIYSRGWIGGCRCRLSEWETSEPLWNCLNGFDESAEARDVEPKCGYIAYLLGPDEDKALRYYEEAARLTKVEWMQDEVGSYAAALEAAVIHERRGNEAKEQEYLHLWRRCHDREEELGGDDAFALHKPFWCSRTLHHIAVREYFEDEVTDKVAHNRDIFVCDTAQPDEAYITVAEREVTRVAGCMCSGLHRRCGCDVPERCEGETGGNQCSRCSMLVHGEKWWLEDDAESESKHSPNDDTDEEEARKDDTEIEAPQRQGASRIRGFPRIRGFLPPELDWSDEMHGRRLR